MDKQEFENRYNESCKRGLHPLKTIFRDPGVIADTVVRWCPLCGAIVIDNDCDGRVYPGKTMQMKLPVLTQLFKGE